MGREGRGRPGSETTWGEAGTPNARDLCGNGIFGCLKLGGLDLLVYIVVNIAICDSIYIVYLVGGGICHQ